MMYRTTSYEPITIEWPVTVLEDVEVEYQEKVEREVVSPITGELETVLVPEIKTRTEQREKTVMQTQVIDFVARSVTVDGEARPMTAEEEELWPSKEQIDAFRAEDAAMLTERTLRDRINSELSNAILVTQNSPYGTPEEQAIVDNTVNEALAAYRALPSPSELTIKLATDLLSWRIV